MGRHFPINDDCVLCLPTPAMDFRKAFDHTVRQLKREVNRNVLRLPEAELKAIDATDNEPWGPHGSYMADIANATYNRNDMHSVMAVLWRRINDTGKNWRHVYKSLIILEYIVANGSREAVEEIQDHIFQIQPLIQFQYVEQPTLKDQGLNVRKKAQDLLNILTDKEKIIEIRKKAEANRNKHAWNHGISSTGGAFTAALGNQENVSREDENDGYTGRKFSLSKTHGYSTTQRDDYDPERRGQSFSMEPVSTLNEVTISTYGKAYNYGRYNYDSKDTRPPPSYDEIFKQEDVRRASVPSYHEFLASEAPPRRMTMPQRPSGPRDMSESPSSLPSIAPPPRYDDFDPRADSNQDDPTLDDFNPRAASTLVDAPANLFNGEEFEPSFVSAPTQITAAASLDLAKRAAEDSVNSSSYVNLYSSKTVHSSQVAVEEHDDFKSGQSSKVAIQKHDVTYAVPVDAVTTRDTFLRVNRCPQVLKSTFPTPSLWNSTRGSLKIHDAPILDPEPRPSQKSSPTESETSKEGNQKGNRRLQSLHIEHII